MKARYFASGIHLGAGTTVDQLSWPLRHVRIGTLTSQLKDIRTDSVCAERYLQLP
jgi:hypothetical protein